MHSEIEVDIFWCKFVHFKIHTGILLLTVITLSHHFALQPDRPGGVPGYPHSTLKLLKVHPNYIQE